MSDYTASVDVVAPPARVWGVLVDVERWHEWTETVLSAKRLDAGPLAPGARTRMVQPELRPAVWQVTELNQAEGVFVWVSRNPGIDAIAGHFVAPTPAGTRVTLTVQFSGVLAPLVRLAQGKKTQEYIRTEAARLKVRSET